MPQQLDLTEYERAAATGEVEAVGKLLSRLAGQPTPEADRGGMRLGWRRDMVARCWAISGG